MTKKNSVKLDRVDSSAATPWCLHVRWSKLTHDEHDVLVATSSHRIVLDPGSDISATIDAVNGDLTAQGYGVMSSADEQRLRSEIRWMPEVLAAFEADRSRRRGEAEAERITAEADRKARDDAEQQRIDEAVDKAMDRMARTILFDGKNKT